MHLIVQIHHVDTLGAAALGKRSFPDLALHLKSQATSFTPSPKSMTLDAL